MSIARTNECKFLRSLQGLEIYLNVLILGKSILVLDIDEGFEIDGPSSVMLDIGDKLEVPAIYLLDHCTNKRTTRRGLLEGLLCIIRLITLRYNWVLNSLKELILMCLYNGGHYDQM